MNADEILLIRDIRRMFGKRQFDSGRMEVNVTRGHVSLSGIVKTLRQNPEIDLKEEVAELEKRLKKDSRVKTLTVTFRYMQAEKKPREHEEEAHKPHAISADNAEEITGAV